MQSQNEPMKIEKLSTEEISQIKQEMRQNVENLADELRRRSESASKVFGKKTRHYYSDASSWIKQNYGKTLVAVGVLAVAGATAYFLTKKDRKKGLLERL
ncbi:MAG: hypothetical protein A3K03_09390 [Bdellovibrionales bacterium RIFOXYD1_FULL_44_7]|nr:MAG: hypothetical protein A3K03_09390 [Bdellovibrionales bacterium RIFOXYD1_FULL_44_7]